MPLRISCLNHRLTSPKDAATDDLHLRERRWFAVRTAAKHEKKAERELSQLGLECYVPLRERVYNYKSKKVTRRLPLLTGYVFVRIRKDEEAVVYGSHYARYFVRLGRERRRVTEEEIALLRTLSTDRSLDWETIEDVFAFTAGTPVEIISGPLAGVKGHYVAKKSKKTFVISLGGIGACLATCEIDPRLLMPLSGEPDADLAEEKATDERKQLW